MKQTFRDWWRENGDDWWFENRDYILLILVTVFCLLRR